MAANSTPTPQSCLTLETVVSAEGKVTLICRGRIAVETSDAFKRQVKDLAPQHQVILADLREVDFVDSSGLGAVLSSFLSARSRGCELKLINVNSRVKDLLDLTRLSSVLEM